MGITVVVDDARYEVPEYDDWDGVEIATIERELGLNMGTIGSRQGTAPYVFLWVAAHRNDPTKTLAEILRIPFGKITVIETEDDADPPADGADGGAQSDESLSGLPSETVDPEPSGPPS